MKPMAPRCIFHHISFRSTILQSFTFRSIKQKHQRYLLYRLSISIISHFESNHEGIDNPFIALGASLFDCLCRYLVMCALSLGLGIRYKPKIRFLPIVFLGNRLGKLKTEKNTSKQLTGNSVNQVIRFRNRFVP